MGALQHEKLVEPPKNVEVAFSHIHLYTDHIDDISVYKDLEQKLNSFADTVDVEKMHPNLVEYKEVWQNQFACGEDSATEFVSQGRDIIKQLMAGLGFRITAVSNENDTKNVLVTTKDPHGVQFVVSALEKSPKQGGDDVVDEYQHFDSSEIQRFYKEHRDRQGIAVLAFQINDGDIDSLFQKYQATNPKLIAENCKSGAITYEDDGVFTKVLEVYSYYKNEKGGEVDMGTKLRFVQKVNAPKSGLILPGLVPVEAEFDSTAMPAYCDHWVSNVISRTGFIDTLEETLGFTPKVDFNAGVVAAGEAQIESTVTGNDSHFETNEREKVLKDQSQVYLPINNALNEFSHVHGFLDELGQGVQHVASRVDDLPQFIQRGNDFREITGEGFTFLKIPRSYYGVLTTKLLEDRADLSGACADAVLSHCEKNGLVVEGAVDLQLTPDQLLSKFDGSFDRHFQKEFEQRRDIIVDTILRSRYINMYNLLGNSLMEDAYLSIVRNQILVDVQGKDILFQIFTSNILQREVGDESPFLEFIQRVCADCSDDDCPLGMKAGCGGFGIRNFLTLFLSIEIGKAMLEVSQAKATGDSNALTYARWKVDAFTNQLNESNPILTAITDAMTEEGIALERMQEALERGDEVQAAKFKEQMQKADSEKHANNVKLIELNSKYNKLMKSIRLDAAL